MRRVCAVDISRRYKSVTPSRLGPFGIYGSCSDVVFLDDTTMSQGDLEDKSALGGPLSTKVNRVGFLDSRTTSFFVKLRRLDILILYYLFVKNY